MTEDQNASIVIVRSPAPKGSGGVIIRGLTGADTSLLHRWWNDPDVMTHVGFPNGLNLSRLEVEKISQPPREATPVLQSSDDSS